MPYSTTSENGLVAAFLTKSVERAIPQVRKQPLMFPTDAKRIRARAEIFAALPPEPEDAKLTGATRSLYRRLLALNLDSGMRKAVAGIPDMQPAKSVA